ncbi:MAG: hypothetical protein E6J91_53385, partial [Deltaproteobacteria bacterium]
MSQFRFAALLPLIAGFGCYREAPPQSTLPEPHYVSGPPGGAIDPGSAYAEDADDPDDVDDDAAATAATSSAAQAPGEATADASAAEAPAPAPGDGAQLAAVAAAPEAGDPTTAVSDAEIDATLDGYGQWTDTDDYGEVWSPDATVVGVDFTPYESGGSWAYTDAGWAFACEYPWGWLPFHYGRWAWLHGHWVWVPGHRWGPAWVHWRHGGGVIGWRPIAPHIRDPRRPGYHHHGGNGGTLVRDHRHAEQHDAHWRFATVSDFGRPHVRSHLYGNLAEGLRLTTRVARPPIQARTAIRPADLMRSRFAAARAGQPWTRGQGPAQIRDHRGAEAIRSVPPPAQGARPMRYPPTQPPQAYRPPSAQPPVRTYQPPIRTYQPPVRMPPSQPPVRTVQPHAPPSAPPSRAWSPPAHASPPTGSHASGGSSHASSGGGSHAGGSSGSHSSSSSGGSHSSSSSG